MTTEQLQYLLEISRNPSLNSASQKLHITPQALSISIKKLAKYPLISYTPLIRGKGEETLFHNLYNSPTEVLIETNFSMFKEKIMHNIANSLAVFFETEEQPTNYFEGVKVVEIRNNIKTYLGFIKKKDATLPPQATFFLYELSRQIGSSSKNF